jgi:hypothetical protein
MPIIEIHAERDRLVHMHNDYNSRWFDKYPDLRKSIDRLEDYNTVDRNKIIRGIKDIILNYDDELISRNAIEFPMTCARSWYDKDPYTWLVINSLRYLDEDLITDIIIYLNEKM